MKEKILVIGDVMLDKYTFGEVKRLNPEGPNPLLNVIKEEYRLGGSANVAANIASLNGKCKLIGVVGNDENRFTFESNVKKYNIDFYPIVLESYQTVVKQRFVENTYHQQLLRVDYEKIEISEYEARRISENILEFIKNLKPKIIVVSDYNKGIVYKNWIDKLKNVAKENDILLLADSKPKNYELFKDFYLIKPNFKEFCEIIGKEIENEDKQIEKYGMKFVKKMNINLVITRGAKGASLITKEGKCYHLKTEAKKVFDVSGAGDTFIATIAYALNQGYDLIDAVKLANKASGIVVGKVGTAIVEKNELFINKC